MGEQDKDPLHALLLDASEVDRTRLAQGLEGIVGLDSASGRLVLRPGFNELDSARKVTAYLLGALAAHLLELRDDDKVTPSEIQTETGLPKGTVNPKVSQLHKERRISKTKAGAYFIAPHQIDAALTQLRVGDRGGDSE
jgi:hypothetical protein